MIRLLILNLGFVLIQATFRTAVFSQSKSSLWPHNIFSPYCDLSLTPTFNINWAQKQTGNAVYTLSFITADASGTPSWGGRYAASTQFYMKEISTLRSKGGDVIVSFGGFVGPELALSILDPIQLQKAYQMVIDTYSLSYIDFDIEGTAVVDVASNTRRAQALSALQAANPGLKVSFTFPVTPTGLDQNCLNALSILNQAGVVVDVVNIMAMDYQYVQPVGSMSMGQYAINAAISTNDQIHSLGIQATIGVTPMIGQNDIANEIFQISDAQQLVEFAQGTSWVTFLGYWSLNRDTSVQGPLYMSSQINQNTFDFLTVFQNYTAVYDAGPSGNLSLPQQPESERTSESIRNFHSVFISLFLSLISLLSFV